MEEKKKPEHPISFPLRHGVDACASLREHGTVGFKPLFVQHLPARLHHGSRTAFKISAVWRRQKNQDDGGPGEAPCECLMPLSRDTCVNIQLSRRSRQRPRRASLFCMAGSCLQQVRMARRGSEIASEKVQSLFVSQPGTEGNPKSAVAKH